MTTRKIYVAKIESKDTETGIVKSLKEMTITIPKNVVDIDYFTECVQYHIYRIATVDTLARLENAKNKLAQLKVDGKKLTLAYEKAEKTHNELALLASILKQAIKEFDDLLLEEYEDIAKVKDVFELDSFGKLFAWSIGNYTSYSIYKTGDEVSKGKLEKIHLHIKDEDKIIGLLKEFDNASGNAEQKKQSAKQVELFANNTFATDGGELYKKVSFKFSVEKVNRELYSRFKKTLTHDGKGNIKDTENTAFSMALQVFYLCLVQLGVPTINGQKIVKVEEIATCSNTLVVKRKGKEK